MSLIFTQQTHIINRTLNPNPRTLNPSLIRPAPLTLDRWPLTAGP